MRLLVAPLRLLAEVFGDSLSARLTFHPAAEDETALALLLIGAPARDEASVAAQHAAATFSLAEGALAARHTLNSELVLSLAVVVRFVDVDQVVFLWRGEALVFEDKHGLRLCV